MSRKGVVQVNLEPADIAELRQMAKREGMTLSATVRRIIRWTFEHAREQNARDNAGLTARQPSRRARRNRIE